MIVSGAVGDSGFFAFCAFVLSSGRLGACFHFFFILSTHIAKQAYRWISWFAHISIIPRGWRQAGSGKPPYLHPHTCIKSQQGRWRKENRHVA